MKHIMLPILAFSLHAGLSPVNANAQQIGGQGTSDCMIQHFRDVANVELSIAERISVLRSITREQYEGAQQKGHLAGVVRFASIEIQPDLKWEDFNSRREAYTSNYSFGGSTDQHLRYYGSYLTNLSVEAYRECLRARRNPGLGLNVRIVSGGPDSQDIQLVVSYIASTGDSRERRIHVDAAGGTARQRQLQRVQSPFRGPSSDMNLTLRRAGLDEDLIVDFDVEYMDGGANPDPNSSYQLRISRRADVFRRLLDTQSVTSSINPHAQGTGGSAAAESCVLAVKPGEEARDQDWRIQVESGIGWTYRGVGTGYRSCVMQPLSITPQRACARVTVFSDRSHDAGCDAIISATRFQYQWVNLNELGPLAEDPNLTYAQYLRLTGRIH